jgi:hypothetical protein
MKVNFRFAAYGTLAALNALLLVLLHQMWPKVGADLSYFLPRLIDVHLHYLCNGLSLQWWTPSFGGGLPAFPNPQHTQFMLAQFVLPLTDPWTANVLNLLLPLSLGYLLILKFCREYLSWSPGAALITATVFATNNFVLNHGFAGHVGYAMFPLLAALPFGLHARLHPLPCISVLAVVGAMIVISGGYSIIVVYALTALLLAIGLALYDHTAFPPGRSCLVLAGGATLTAMAMAAKVCAVALFLRHFPREISDPFPAQGWLNAWLSIPGRFFLLKSSFLLHRLLGLDTSALLAPWAGVNHERDLGLSPVVLLLVPVGFFVWVRHWTGPAKLWLALALCLAVWITIEFASGQGLLWPCLKSLPFLRLMHANARFGSAFILPLALLAGLGAQMILRSSSFRLGPVLVTIGIVVTLGSLLQFRRQMNGLPFSGFDVSESQRVWTAIRNGERWRPIATIADVDADQVFAVHASNWKPYEPIFGYGYAGPNFRTRLQPGPILPAHEGEPANFHFPLAFYAPDLAGQEAFAPLPATRVTELRVLLDRRQPRWPQPAVQTVADIISVLGLAGIAIVLLFSGWHNPPQSRPQPLTFPLWIHQG